MKKIISITCAYLLLAFEICAACEAPKEEAVGEEIQIKAGFNQFISDIVPVQDSSEDSKRTASRLEIINNMKCEKKQIAEPKQSDIELLALIIRAEAGNQSLEGKRAVADVVLNRVDSEQFPDTLKEVIYQEGQFNCVADGSFATAVYTKDETDYEAARIELSNRTDTEILYFQTNSYSPYGTPAYVIGDHYFAKQ